MSKRQRGSRAKGTRRRRRTVLIATNGRSTEIQYLTRLKARVDHTKIQVTIEFVDGQPATMMRKLSSPKGDTSAYDEVWLVVDEDQSDRAPLVRECADKSTTRQLWGAVVTRPSFEAWLVAHYARVHNYQDQTDAARHYSDQAGIAPGVKSLPESFPLDECVAAADRCTLPGTGVGELNDLPPSPGSGMPHLLRSLGLME